VVGIPTAHRFSVAVFIEMFVLVVILAVFVVTFSVAVPLGEGETASKHENSQSAGEKPSRGLHSSLQSQGWWPPE
jgi:uncharacterized membrane protein